jgi:hypothetical protein
MTTANDVGQMTVKAPDRAALRASIAALRGEEKPAAQETMAAFAAELAAGGARVAGVVQERLIDSTTGRKRIVLRDLASGALYPISQDLGPGSTACNLDGGELAKACGALETAAREGADLLVISKFSKVEAERGGFSDAFRLAIARRVPILTAVSPHYLAEWRDFSGDLARFHDTNVAALRAWWRILQQGA